MRMNLTEERRLAILSELTRYYSDEFEEKLSAFRAEGLLDFFQRKLGPATYNQAIQDARGFMLNKLDDLDAEFHEPEDSN
ncbi:MAG: DUF2164 domain-containing protein [bacterium]|nr:DUF2164 domain-containing protein [bacterium]